MNKNWTSHSIPSIENKTFLVTGANSGLGYGTSKELARKGAKVIMSVRNTEKGQTALDKIKAEIPDADLSLMKLDLADLEDVKRFIREFGEKYQKLDVLINNAGVMMPVNRFETRQGFEGQFGTNHLGHFVLTLGLLDLIESTPDSRIVVVSSMVANMKTAAIHWDDLQWTGSFNKMASYAQSKLANLMFSMELHNRLTEKNSPTICLAAHPGYTATNLQQHMGLTGKIMNFLLAQKLEMGILPTLRAATDPDAKGGEYYGPAKMMNSRGYPVLNDPNPVAMDKKITKRLWDVSIELTKAFI